MSTTPERRTCFLVSDHTGISAEALARALLAQFGGLELRKVTLPFVNSAERVEEVLKAIERARREDGARPLVFSTLIDPALRHRLQSADALVMDFFEPFIGRIEGEVERPSSQRVGGAHSFAEGPVYQRRIDAVHFALSTDDGLHSEHYDIAEVVLVGVSRSGKTPTCLYLALQYGIHAANYPVTEEDLSHGRLPDALRPYVSRLCGLTIAPERLHQIRRERRYAALETCRREVRQVEAILQRYRVPMVDTSAASVEEIAATVMARLGLARHTD
jgi:regulator of PEP synthase PpsR (kinase-PPPase family)